MLISLLATHFVMRDLEHNREQPAVSENEEELLPHERYWYEFDPSEFHCITPVIE